MNRVLTPTRIGGLPTLPSAAGAVVRGSRLDRRLGVLLAIAIYTGFAMYLSWPMVTHLGRIFYAESPPGDPIGTMAFYRELVDHNHNPFLPGAISQLAAPEGQTIPWTLDLASMPSVLLQFILTYLFGQVAANGLYVLLGYVLTGTVTFLFIRRLTDSTWIALICGWALAFFPFAILNGQGHTDYIHAWVLVLAVWRVVELHWESSRRNAILAALAVALALWWTPYFILLGGVAYVAASLASLALSYRERRWRATVGLHTLTAGILLVFLGVLASISAGNAGNAAGVRTNNLAEFNTYSARPLEFLIPDAHSLLFGSDTSKYLAAHLHGSNPVESTLYIGVTIVLLAAVATVALARRRLSPRLTSAAAILLVVAGVAFVTSAPPEGSILGVNVPFPSHFIMKVTTTWRAYSRFVVVVMLAVTSLAGIGLSVLVRKSSRRVGIVVMAAATVLIPLDLWARLPQRTDTYRAPSVFFRLAREPRGLTAEYPLTPNGENFYADVFYQNVHGMPMINGYQTGSLQEHRALSLTSLSDPSTGARLAALGVRYVVLEAGPSPYGLPPAGTPRRGFQRIYGDAFATLYRVTARPFGPALPAAGAQFADDEVASDGSTFNWLEEPSGTIRLAGVCTPCQGDLGMTLSSFARPRLVTISAGRTVLWKHWVAAPTRIRVPITYGPIRNVTITAKPGPQSIEQTVGGSDPRSVSVQVADLSFVWASKHGEGT